jgi:hypothetical protein
MANSRQCHQGIQPRECFASFPLAYAYFSCCKPPGQISFIYLVTGEPHQISMSSLLTGKLGHWSSCQLTALIYPLSLQQILAPLMFSCGYKHRFCRKDGEKATSRRKEGDSYEVDKPKAMQTYMRLTCGSPAVGCVLTHLKLLLAARGPPETGFEPRCGRGIVSPKFANFVKYRASRMQTSC